MKGEVPEKGALPDDIPREPAHVYKDGGWASWGDWLGTGRVWGGVQKYRSFEDARRFVRRLGFTGRAEWNRYCRGEIPEKGTLSDDIPATPDRVFKHRGWVSWGEWFGSDKRGE